MPEKSRVQRERIARKRGQTVAVKPRDIGKVGPRSAHGSKKSSQLVALNKPGRRNARVKAPPGGGKKTLAPKLAAYTRSAREELQTENLKPRLHGLQGRKKEPSRAGVKAKGGPFKRSRLKGG